MAKRRQIRNVPHDPKRLLVITPLSRTLWIKLPPKPPPKPQVPGRG